MTTAIEAPTTDLSELPTAELHRILGGMPQFIAAALNRFADAWRLCADRGEDMRRYYEGANRFNPWYHAVRMIAEGCWSAAAVERFGDRGDVFRKVVTRLPVREQERLAAEPLVAVLEPDAGDDSGKHRMVPLQDLDAAQLDRVFDRKAGAIRSPEAQLVYIRQPAPKIEAKKLTRPVKRGRFMIYRDTNRVATDGVDADLEDVIEALKAIGYTIEKAA